MDRELIIIIIYLCRGEFKRTARPRCRYIFLYTFRSDFIQPDISGPDISYTILQYIYIMYFIRMCVFLKRV